MENRESTPDTINGALYRWRLQTPNHQLADKIAKDLGLPPLVALILTTRRITSVTQANDYLDCRLENLHPPDNMPDLDKAVTRIASALEQGEQIAVYGDYDVDGITATALLVHFLSSLGGTVRWYIPHRVQEGYGLNSKALQTMHTEGVTLVITVDCGSTNHEAIESAGTLGLDVIVTDHHLPPHSLPAAIALVNPKRSEKSEELRDLAGVGVAFYLAVALRAHFRHAGRWSTSEQPNLKKYLDWVALGTLADMAPLTGTNRILTRFGLGELTRTSNCGLRALKAICGLEKNTISDWDVLFRLGPRLNAPGRLASGDLAVRFLLSTDSAEARNLALELEELNRQRQHEEKQLLAEVLYLVEANNSFEQKSALVLASPGWHKGLLGLVASRLVERFNKPTILLTQVDQHWEGSGRSFGSFDLYQALYSCRDHLVRFGGHKQAAGLGLRKELLTEFRTAFESIVEEQMDQEDIRRTMKVDAMVHLDEITPELMTYIERMQPYGVDNPEPVFCCRGFQVENLQILKGCHLQLRLKQGKTRFTAIGFNFIESDHPPPVPESLLFSPRWNHWQGENRIQLHLHDYR
ncbi:MAG: single-stranded-DNA-specific exonuclease RecJ [Syntrophobacterales bacterium]|jgi:single-stranded-DNA-specific exonuclease